MFGGLFLALGAIDLVLKGRGYGWLAAGVVLSLVALFIPGVLTPLKRLWLRLSGLLSALVNPIILGLIYVCVFTLIGGLLRLFNRDVLSLRHDPASSSYWIPRNPAGPDPQSLKEQF
jgi:hypothetical protein